MNFTFATYKSTLETALLNGYQIIPVKDFFSETQPEKFVLNRVDVDLKPEKATFFLDILQDLRVKATFFLRIHSPTYNLFEFSLINLIERMIRDGHEIGLHTELADLQGICNRNPESSLRKEIMIIEDYFGIKILGTSSHGDHTGYNNLSFWDNRKPDDFGLVYEAYDQTIFNACRYISDSEWTQWKSYEGGKLLENDRRTPSEHIEQDSPNRIYLLTHPDCYYRHHFHER